MSQLVDIVLPVFALIAFGYLTAVTGWLDRHSGDGLAAFVFSVAVPVLLMRTMVVSEFTQTNPWQLWGAYFSGVICVWAVAALATIFIFRRGYRDSVISGVSAAFSNLVLLGIPLVQLAFGDAGLTILFILIAVHMPLMLTLSTFFMEFSTRADGVDTTRLSLSRIAFSLIKNLAGNPIIIGLLVGLTWRFSGYPMTGLADDITGLLGQTAGPVALFALGMSLNKYGIRGNILPAILLASLSLIFMPAAVYGFSAFVFLLPHFWIKIAVLAAACPSGINAYLFASHFKVAEGLATNTIVVAMIGSIITLPLWLNFLSRL